jgi:hypothetical protein
VDKTNKVASRKMWAGIELEERSKNSNYNIDRRTIIGIRSISMIRGKNKKFFGKSA